MIHSWFTRVGPSNKRKNKRTWALGLKEEGEQ